MNVLFAPLEGVAHHLYRSAQAAVFAPADEYFIPFICPRNCSFSHRERQDVLPENNLNVRAVPQLLTNEAECFLWAAKELRALGYEEVNLNLGCPSGTVVRKRRGAGLLGDTALLERFLTEIFLHSPLRISLKTRLGMDDPAEFEALLALYNRFPVSRLIVHPRVREDYYKGPVRMEGFLLALRESRAPVCYNGDLFTGERIRAFAREYPQVESVMCGRGFLLHPGLMELWRGTGEETVPRLSAFHDRLYAAYRESLGTPTFVLNKMKEVWAYLGAGQRVPDKALKRVRKAMSYAAYEDAVAAALESLTPAEATGDIPSRPGPA